MGVGPLALIRRASFCTVPLMCSRPLGAGGLLATAARGVSSRQTALITAAKLDGSAINALCNALTSTAGFLSIASDSATASSPVRPTAWQSFRKSARRLSSMAVFFEPALQEQLHQFAEVPVLRFLQQPDFDRVVCGLADVR